MKDIKIIFLFHHLESLQDSLYLEISLYFSILAIGIAKLLEQFSKQKSIFFYFNNDVGDALRDQKCKF